MDRQFDEAEALLLSGKGPQEVISYLRKRGCSVYINYTRNGRDKVEVEERVIRIIRKKDEVEVLVGFFQTPQYI
ncbi:MAG: hypothetical protein CVU87_14145 [Firmicutes bacterium HGW-Firmicutes-12]|jgi:hypothetical protein|nr:MAG: hypothetical protein CVU87_14145 [Firmicutes bacterium HGW-Firmicutes-12]